VVAAIGRLALEPAPQLHFLARLLFCLGLCATPCADSLDPQDGPHADVRVTIHDSGVSMNLIVNMAFVDEVVDVPRESPDELFELEAVALKEELLEHFRESIGVTIDEERVEPRLVEFLAPEPDVLLLPLFPRAGMRALLRLQFKLEFEVERPPRLVKLEWSDYPPNPIMETPEGGIPTLEVGILVSGYGKHRIVRFTEQEPEFTWRSSGLSLEDLFRDVPAPPPVPAIELPLAAIALGLAYLVAVLIATFRGGLRRVLMFFPFVLGGGVLSWNVAAWSFDDPFADSSIDAETARSAVGPLLANIYRAFDYQEEKDVYDSLAKSVAGDLLDELYQRIFESLVYQEAEGALARVQRFELVDCTLKSSSIEEGRRRFEATARWQVEGGVYHWSHTHSRLNEYEADFTVADVDGSWRIVDEEVRSATRLDSNPDEGFDEGFMEEGDWDYEEWIDSTREF